MTEVLVQYIISSMFEKAATTVLVCGTKILSITFRNVKLIDSLNFIPLALAKFPKTFNLVELKKGFFPHEFNKFENQNYIGPFPDKKLFGSDFFSVGNKIEFDDWYELNRDRVYDFKKEVEDYCFQADVLNSES
jgi:hypothetical protein